MHAALLTNPAQTEVAQTEVAQSEAAFGDEFTITMLDGGLGGVIDPSRSGALPSADVFCWCGCLVCEAS
jgi:hypothetical protein